MKIAIINAMPKEHEQLVSLLDEHTTHTEGNFTFVEGTFRSQEMVLMQSGIGKVNAAIGAVELIRRYAPSALINTGVAGGIDSCLKVMDVVVGERVAYHDVDCGPESELGQVQGLPHYFHADKALYEAAMSIESNETTLHGGLICSGDQFITDKEQLGAIKSRYADGLAVDMESGALAQTCHLYGVPFLSFRIISDTPGADNHFDQYLNFWDTMANRSFAITKALLEKLAEINR